MFLVCVVFLCFVLCVLDFVFRLIVVFVVVLLWLCWLE